MCAAKQYRNHTHTVNRSCINYDQVNDVMYIKQLADKY